MYMEVTNKPHDLIYMYTCKYTYMTHKQATVYMYKSLHWLYCTSTLVILYLYIGYTVRVLYLKCVGLFLLVGHVPAVFLSLVEPGAAPHRADRLIPVYRLPLSLLHVDIIATTISTHNILEGRLQGGKGELEEGEVNVPGA